MFTRQLRDANRYDTIAALDIETTGLDARRSELVAVGVGYFERGWDEVETNVITRRRTGDDERAVIEATEAWVNERNPGCLVTYNGDYFDLPYLDERATRLDCAFDLDCEGRHVDLMEPRKSMAEALDETWPTLEAVLAAYDLPRHTVRWAGSELTNTRFGEELGPAYLEALAVEDAEVVDGLEETILEYARSDVEATVAVYEADAGREFVPSYAS